MRFLTSKVRALAKLPETRQAMPAIDRMENYKYILSFILFTLISCNVIADDTYRIADTSSGNVNNYILFCNDGYARNCANASLNFKNGTFVDVDLGRAGFFIKEACRLENEWCKELDRFEKQHGEVVIANNSTNKGSASDLLKILVTDSPNLSSYSSTCNEDISRGNWRAMYCFRAGRELELQNDLERAMAAYTRGCNLDHRESCAFKRALRPEMSNPYAIYERQAGSAIQEYIGDNCWGSRIALDRYAIKSDNPKGRALVSSDGEDNCLLNGGTAIVKLSAFEVSNYSCVNPAARKTRCDFTIYMGCFAYTAQTKKQSFADPRVQFFSNQFCGNINRNRKATGEIITNSDGSVTAQNVVFLDGF